MLRVMKTSNPDSMSPEDILPIEGATTARMIAFNDQIRPLLQQIQALAIAHKIPWYATFSLGEHPTCPPGASNWVQIGHAEDPAAEANAADENYLGDALMRLGAHRVLANDDRALMALGGRFMMQRAAYMGEGEGGGGGGLGGLLGALLAGRKPAGMRD